MASLREISPHDRQTPLAALKGIPGVGPVLFQRLLDRFGQPARVFQARGEDLLTIRGVNRDLARDLLALSPWGPENRYQINDSLSS